MPPRLRMMAKIRPGRYGIEKKDNATLPTSKDNSPWLIRLGLAGSAFRIGGAGGFDAAAGVVFAGIIHAAGRSWQLLITFDDISVAGVTEIGE